ncbi:MAG: M20/M25/M40 family metallo-hydrolase [Thermoplasmata archaeon]|nr:M20/M25/M40 family metallo-hydrolase [Thermoplasmata archaeon]
MLPAVELTRELIRFPSVLGSENGIAGFIYEKLRSHASKIYYQDTGDGRKNLIAFGKKGRKNPVLLNAHMDTVEVMQNWSLDPFGGIEREGKLYGLGACDMKAGLGIFMALFAELSEKLPVVFTACADEEGESLGAYQLIKHLREIECNPEIVLISEPTDEKVMLGARGRVVLEIDVRGKSAHGARPHLGVNAISEAARIVEMIDGLAVGSHEKMGRGSFCTLKIAGGANSLSVPEHCKLIVDRHYVVGESQEGIRETVEREIRKLGLKGDVNVGFVSRRVPFLKPYITEETGAVREFVNLVNSEIIYGQSVGDFNLFGETWPTVVYGPAGGNWHSGDEFVHVESIERVYGRYLEFLEKFL